MNDYKESKTCWDFLTKSSSIDQEQSKNIIDKMSNELNKITTKVVLKCGYKVLLIFYHGGPFGDGQIYPQLNYKKMGDTGLIYESIFNYSKKKGDNVVGAVIAPSYTQDPGVNSGKRFLNKYYQTGDLVIIYAYSYGGDCAVSLADEMPDIPIKLLIIVDSSDGPAQGLTVNMTIPDNVEVAYNYYQEHLSGTPSGSGKSSNSSGSDYSNLPASRGYPHSSKGKAIVKNILVTNKGVTHGTIQKIVREKIENQMQNVIDQKRKLCRI